MWTKTDSIYSLQLLTSITLNSVSNLVSHYHMTEEWHLDGNDKPRWLDLNESCILFTDRPHGTFLFNGVTLSHHWWRYHYTIILMRSSIVQLWHQRVGLRSWSYDTISQVIPLHKDASSHKINQMSDVRFKSWPSIMNLYMREKFQSLIHICKEFRQWKH